MIPARNKGTLENSHIAKDTTKTHPSQQSWVYQVVQPRITHKAKCTTRHSQAKIQLGQQATIQSNLPWVNRLLRRWKGRKAKLVVHSRTRDTYTRSIWHGIHNYCTPTQGSILFFAPQSLGLCLPFQCSSGLCSGDLPATLIF